MLDSNRKSKIIFALPNLRGGGAERVVSIILRNLDPSKFDIHLIIGQFTGPNTKNIPKHVHVHVIGSIRSYQVFFPLIKIIKKIDPDFVFATLGFVNVVTLGKFFLSNNTKVIIRYGNTLSSYLKEVKSESIFRYYLDFYLTIFSNYFSDLIVAQCNYMKNDLINTFGLNSKIVKKIIVIYNPIESDQIHKLSLDNSLSTIDYHPNSGPFLISVGNLKKQKGFDLLIEAMVHVKYVFPNIILNLYGEGQEKMKIQNLIQKYNLGSNIFLRGFSKNPYYDLSKSDLYVNSSRYEGFSNSIIESLSLGIPVVATDCPSGVREVVFDGENGFLSSFDYLNRVQNLAEAIIKALKEKKLLKAKIQMDEHNLKFGKKIFLKKIESLFNQYP